MSDTPQLTLGRQGPLLDAHAALKSRLEALFPPRQFAHHQVPAQFSKATWERLGARTPFVGLGFAALDPDKDNGSVYNARTVWQVFAGVRQPRPDAMLQGDPYLPGLLGMAGLVVAAMHGLRQPPLGTWMCGPVSNLYDERWATDELGVVGVEVSMRMQVVDDAAAAALPELLRVGLAWDLPEMPATTLDVRTA